MCDCKKQIETSAVAQGLVNPSLQASLCWNRKPGSPAIVRTYSNISHDEIIKHGRGKGKVKRAETSITHSHCPFCGEKYVDGHPDDFGGR